MNWLLKNAEIVGTAAGFLCVWLTVRQNIWNWPLGLVNNLFFLVVLAQDHLYANVGLQIVFIILGFYGWWVWLYGGANRTPLPVSRLRPALWATGAAIWVAGSVALALGLQEMTQRAGLPAPDYVYWDSSIAVASLLAQWMLTRKKIENWLVWIITVNLSQVFLFTQKERYLMAGLQIAYGVLSLQGYRAWRKDLSIQESNIARSVPEAVATG